MGKLMFVVEESAYRPSSWVIPLSSLFEAGLFIDDDVFCFLEEEAWCAADSARGFTMAVALATLPMKRVLAGAGDTGFGAATTGVDLADVFAEDLITFAAGFGAGFGMGWAETVFGVTDFTGFPAVLAGTRPDLAAAGLAILETGLPLTGFFGAGFFVTGFFAATLAAGVFLAAAFFVAGALTEAGFFAADLTEGLLATFLGATFFAAALAAGLAATFGFALATTGFAFAAFAFATTFAAALTGVLLALFTAAPLPETVLDLPALPADEAFPLCALAAVELRVVFAISLHR